MHPSAVLTQTSLDQEMTPKVQAVVDKLTKELADIEAACNVKKSELKRHEKLLRLLMNEAPRSGRTRKGTSDAVA